MFGLYSFYTVSLAFRLSFLSVIWIAKVTLFAGLAKYFTI